MTEHPVADGGEPPRAEALVPYNSTGETLVHARRVGQLLAEVIAELARRAVTHDQSKIEEPELAVFNEYTPKLKHSTYGSDEYKAFLVGMGAGLEHHYQHNRHHPEHHAGGVAGMNLVDLIEMLADWRAATERHADGNLVRSLRLNQDRFQISEQLSEVLGNTAFDLHWFTQAELEKRSTGRLLQGRSDDR